MGRHRLAPAGIRNVALANQTGVIPAASQPGAVLGAAPGSQVEPKRADVSGVQVDDPQRSKKPPQNSTNSIVYRLLMQLLFYRKVAKSGLTHLQ